MIITIIAEPRSGSTNLANWFYMNKDYTVLYLPSDVKSKWYKNCSPKDYEYTTKHLVIKEDFYENKKFDELISVSDKIILLFRENEKEQIESWINAKKTNNWDKSWSWNEINYDNTEINFLKNLKKSFKEKYNNMDFFKISYEKLYYENGFEKLLEYLSIDSLKKENFPYGHRYRQYVNKTRNFI